MTTRKRPAPPAPEQGSPAQRPGPSQRHSAALTIASALRPIVDLCIAQGITSPEMERVLRGVFIEQAERALAGPGDREASDLRVGLMTGVHRNFVREIRATKPRARLQKVHRRHKGDALLHAWATDWEFLTSAGTPRELPIQPKPDQASFASLAARYMPNVAPRTAVAELERAGLVQTLDGDHVRLRSRSARPLGVNEANLTEAGTKLAGFASTLLHNLKHPDDARVCEYSELIEIPTKRLPVVRRTITKRAQNFLDGLTGEIQHEADTEVIETTAIRVTVFCHEQPEKPRATTERRRNGKS